MLVTYFECLFSNSTQGLSDVVAALTRPLHYSGQGRVRVLLELCGDIDLTRLSTAVEQCACGATQHTTELGSDLLLFFDTPVRVVVLRVPVATRHLLDLLVHGVLCLLARTLTVLVQRYRMMSERDMRWRKDETHCDDDTWQGQLARVGEPW